MAKEDFKNIGAAWKKTSKAGNDYLAISFDREAIKGMDLSNMNIMVFPTRQKKTPTSPDYSISATERSVEKSYQKRPEPQSAPNRPSPVKPKNHAPSSQPAWAADESDF